MNERLKELAVQAGLALTPNTKPISWFGLATDLERFAELVRADEREACAKVCEEDKIARPAEYVRHLERVVAAIRARGNHEQD
jgi:hypothetical protein